MGPSGPPNIFLFEGFRFDRRGGELLRLDEAGIGSPVAIGSRALDLLGMLVERQGDDRPKMRIARLRAVAAVSDARPGPHPRLTHPRRRHPTSCRLPHGPWPV
jgi:hypothetical protein